jgi:hypothetical protein
MNDRDDFAELVGKEKSIIYFVIFFSEHIFDLLGSVRNVIKCSSLYFNGRIRYGTKGEKVEERLLVIKKTQQEKQK